MTTEYIQKHLGGYVELFNKIMSKWLEYKFEFWMIDRTGIAIDLKNGVSEELGTDTLSQELSLEIMSDNMVRLFSRGLDTRTVEITFNADDVVAIRWNCNETIIRRIEEVSGERMFSK